MFVLPRPCSAGPFCTVELGPQRGKPQVVCSSTHRRYKRRRDDACSVLHLAPARYDGVELTPGCSGGFHACRGETPGSSPGGRRSCSPALCSASVPHALHKSRPRARRWTAVRRAPRTRVIPHSAAHGHAQRWSPRRCCRACTCWAGQRRRPGCPARHRGAREPVQPDCEEPAFVRPWPNAVHAEHMVGGGA